MCTLLYNNPQLNFSHFLYVLNLLISKFKFYPSIQRVGILHSFYNYLLIKMKLGRLYLRDLKICILFPYFYCPTSFCSILNLSHINSERALYQFVNIRRHFYRSLWICTLRIKLQIYFSYFFLILYFCYFWAGIL